MLDKRGWEGVTLVKKDREAWLHTISTAICVSAANCTLVFLKSASARTTLLSTKLYFLLPTGHRPLDAPQVHQTQLGPS